MGFPLANDDGPLFGSSGPLYMEEGGENDCECCETVTWCYYRFKLCDGDTDSDYWARVGTVEGEESCPTLSRGWVYQTDDGTCYYLSEGQSGTTDDHSADFLPVPNTEVEACNLCPVTFWTCFGCPEGCVVTSITWRNIGSQTPPCIPYATEGGIDTPNNWHEEWTGNPFVGNFELVRYSNASDHKCCFRYKKSVAPFTTSYLDDSVEGTTTCSGTTIDPDFSGILITNCDTITPGVMYRKTYPPEPFPWETNPFSNSSSPGDYFSSCLNVPLPFDDCETPRVHVETEPVYVAEADGGICQGTVAGGTTTATLHMECDEEPPP